MSDNLPMDPSKYSQEELAKLLGQDTGQSGSYGLPRLKINYDFEDDDGNELKPGQFTFHHPEHGWLYAKKVYFRPFLNCYRFMIYNPQENKMENTSIYFQDFREEIPDEQGGMACGWVPRKKHGELSDAAKAHQEKVQCYRIVFGEVRADEAKDAKGNTVEFEPTLVSFRVRGANFMPIGQAIDEINRAKKLMLNHEIEMTTKREKNGGTTYYVAQPKVDLTNSLPFKDTDGESLRTIWDEIKQENSRVMQNHKKHRGGPSDYVDAEYVEVSDQKSLDNDFDDELPDAMKG